MAKDTVKDAIEQLLNERKIEHRFRMGGKHPYVEFKLAGKTVNYTFPGSPGDHRAIINNLAGIKRLLGEHIDHKICKVGLMKSGGSGHQVRIALSKELVHFLFGGEPKVNYDRLWVIVEPGKGFKLMATSVHGENTYKLQAPPQAGSQKYSLTHTISVAPSKLGLKITKPVKSEQMSITLHDNGKKTAFVSLPEEWYSLVQPDKHMTAAKESFEAALARAEQKKDDQLKPSPEATAMLAKVLKKDNVSDEVKAAVGLLNELLAKHPNRFKLKLIDDVAHAVEVWEKL